MRVARVGEAELPDLLPLVRGYCDFYGVAPSDAALLALSRALIADPARESVQFLARSEDGAARLTWQTAKDSLRAQALYDRVGGTREEWPDHWLDA